MTARPLSTEEIATAQHRRRQRLRKLTDAELIHTGRSLRDLVASARLVVSPPGSPPDTWEDQLTEAIAEWKERARRRPWRSCRCHVPSTAP